jgi:phenylacetic acid degradation operon negative regulatory protein
MAFTRPQDLVFTLFGDFLLHRPGPVWVGSLIELLEPLGLSATNVRTVLSRMAKKGWLESERGGRRSYYSLTGRGRRLLEEGETRIYRPREREEWDGEWTLVAYSIPEERRAQRDRLRVRLEWLGLGSLGNGLWISPHDVVDRVCEVAGELGVSDDLEVFRGDHVAPGPESQLVNHCWDLEALNGEYEAFIARHLDECRGLAAEPGSMAPREAYVRRFRLVHEYREFPLKDPFLPSALQPEDWAGECALSLFNYYRGLLAEPADRFVEPRVETSADRNAAPVSI